MSGYKRKAGYNNNSRARELCVKVEVAVLGSPSLMIVLVVVSTEVPYHVDVVSYVAILIIVRSV